MTVAFWSRFIWIDRLLLGAICIGGFIGFRIGLEGFFDDAAADVARMVAEIEAGQKQREKASQPQGVESSQGMAPTPSVTTNKGVEFPTDIRERK